MMPSITVESVQSSVTRSVTVSTTRVASTMATASCSTRRVGSPGKTTSGLLPGQRRWWPNIMHMSQCRGINGKLTLGENIADNSGLAIAFKAYKISLNGHPAEVVDGFTGDQRFFMGWAQVWRGKYREYEQIRRIKVDPHSPPSVRGVAPLKNQDAFFDAFNMKDGDRMFIAPAKRV